MAHLRRRAVFTAAAAVTARFSLFLIPYHFYDYQHHCRKDYKPYDYRCEVVDEEAQHFYPSVYFFGTRLCRGVPFLIYFYESGLFGRRRANFRCAEIRGNAAARGLLNRQATCLRRVWARRSRARRRPNPSARTMRQPRAAADRARDRGRVYQTHPRGSYYILTFVLRVLDSWYGLKIIYNRTAKTTTAAISPIIFRLPVNAEPTWKVISETA